MFSAEPVTQVILLAKVINIHAQVTIMLLAGRENLYKTVIACVAVKCSQKLFSMATNASKSRKPVMSHERYLYRFQRRGADDGKFCSCLQDGCQGRIANDVFIEFCNNSQKHPRDPDGVAVKEIVTTLNHPVLLDFMILIHCHCRCLFLSNSFIF